MAEINANLISKLAEMAEQFTQVERDLSDPTVVADLERLKSLGLRRAALEPMVRQWRDYESLQNQITEHEQIVTDEQDGELVELARAELPEMRDRAKQMIDDVANELVTAEDRSVGSVILELRAGTGGAEAALWAGDLLEMYQRYAAAKGWKFDLLDLSPGDQGGVRQAVVNVQGLGVWQSLGYDGGVHCVKRVPATEAQGRIHTSTATVAVLPEPEQVDIQIPDSDVQINVTTAQGPGGQNVNKVATAVHMIHLPTGIEVRMQESKSQKQNRQKAWKLLRARVFDRHQREKDAQRAENRAKMIGSGERSQRCRTYRYKESIVVDHRVNRSFNLQTVLAGNLDEMVDALITQDRAQRLAAL